MGILSDENRRLIEQDAVLFAGYRMPHPLEPHVELRVQTKRESTPVQAVGHTLDRMLMEVKKLDEKFKVQSSMAISIF